MGYYENVSCRKCNYSFSGGFASSNGFMKTKVGPPALVCPKCNKVNITSWVPYSLLSKYDKVYHWTSVYVRYSIWGFIVGLIIGGLLIKFLLIKTEIEGPLLFFTIFLAVLAFNIYGHRSEWKDINETESEYQRLLQSNVIKHI
jgi:hypothetical protein